MKVRLLSSTPMAEAVCAAAAAGCYSSDNSYQIAINATEDGDTKLLERVIKSGHLSVLEHATFTFSIEGISRVCSHQLVRHRVASYSQQSQRYVYYDVNSLKLEDMFVIPPAIEGNESLKNYYLDSVHEAMHEYDVMVEDLKDIGKTDEQAQEDARYLLPNAAKTNITVTMNARELIHFFNVRMCNRAQWEIRELANTMHQLCMSKAPNIFRFAGPNCVIDVCKEGKHACGKPYPKRRI